MTLTCWSSAPAAVGPGLQGTGLNLQVSYHKPSNSVRMRPLTTLIWCDALNGCHMQVIFGACMRFRMWTKPTRCMVATPESAYLSRPCCCPSGLTVLEHLCCRQSTSHIPRYNQMTMIACAGAHPTASCGIIDPVCVSPCVCRFSAQNYGAKVGIVELPFAFIPDDKHGGAGGTCVAERTRTSERMARYD